MRQTKEVSTVRLSISSSFRSKNVPKIDLRSFNCRRKVDGSAHQQISRCVNNLFQSHPTTTWPVVAELAPKRMSDAFHAPTRQRTDKMLA